jgi:hypothetical protein
MIGKKINQLATELAPVSTDLTIIGDPTTGVSKKITLAQLGAIFSGAVSFYTNLAGFPAVGDINVIYCAKDTQKLYLWSGSAYVEVFPSQALLDTYQLRSEKGNANGYASLDSGGKVPISQLPSSIMEYKGTWNASTNTPTLANGTGDTGDVYICNVAGTVNFGAGPITFAVGDYVIYSGTIWQRSSGAVGTVTSVAATITGDSLTISGSPVTTSGTLAFAFNGTTAQYIRGNGTLETFPSLTGFVPYTGATANVDLGTHTLLAKNLVINHSSGSGVAASITKGGSGEALTVVKSSGSGNAASITGGVTLLDELHLNTDLADAYIASATNWNAAYNDKINSAAVTGTTTKTLTLTQQDGGTITASWTDDNTDAVTSVFGRTGAVVAASGDYNTSQVTENTNLYFTNARAIASTLTGYTSGAGTITSSDSILSAIQKLNGNIGALTTGVSSVNGLTGAVTLTTSNIAEGTNLYYTEARVSANTDVAANTAARHNAVTIGTANGLSLSTQVLSLGLASTSTTGALSSTDWNTFNNKTSNTGTVTSVGLSSATSGVTIGSTPITTSGTITLAIATASGSQQGLLSSTDWTTFNNKQNALTNPVTGTGTTNYLPKFTGASTIGDSIISEGSGTISITNSSTITSAMANPQLRLINNATATINQRIDLGLRWEDGTYNGIGGISMVRESSTARSGKLVLSGINSSGDPNEAVTITSTGNLGLGVTPSAWASGYTVLQVLNLSLFGTSGLDLNLASNTYYDGTSYKYIGNGFATMYNQFQGKHYWSTAGTSTAGNAISFTQAMTLHASGNLSVGNTSDVEKIYVSGNIRLTSGNSFKATYDNSDNYHAALSWATLQLGNNGDNRIIGGRTAAGGNLKFYVNNTNDATNYATTPNGILALTIASTGAATFSGDVGLGNGASLTWGGSYGANIPTIAALAGASPYIAFYPAGSTSGERMRITSGGNVGIGTTSPTNKLDVSTPNKASVLGSTSAINVDYTTSTIGEYQTIGFSYSSSVGNKNQYWGMGFTATSYAAGLGDVFFFTGGAERARISSAGYLGIGTTSPSDKLHVVGGGIITGDFYNNSATGNHFISAAPANVNYPTYGFYGDTGLGMYRPTTDALGFVTNDTERMRILANGNVGIGAATPNARLTVVANDSSNPNVALRLSSTAYSGVSYPNTSLRFGSDYPNYPTWNLASIDSSYTGNNWGGSLLFFTNNDSTIGNLTERMRITSGGSVLIGTTTEGFLGKLQVAGSVAITGQYNTVLPSSSFSYFDGSGQVVSSSSNASALYLDTTWNTTGNPDGIYLNVTNTASGASSKLLNLKVGSVSQFSVSKAGAIQTTAPSSGSAQPWKLGSYAAGGTGTATGVIYIEINGQIYSIPALQGTP